jgi:hypothetical protein
VQVDETAGDDTDPGRLRRIASKFGLPEHAFLGG